MSVGTSTALLIGAGITAGTQVVGDVMSAHASKDAAKTQSDAAQQAASYSQQQTKQAMDYINGLRSAAQPGTANSGAYATLSRLTGGAAPMGTSGPSAAYPNLFGAAAPSTPNAAPMGLGGYLGSLATAPAGGAAAQVTLMDDNGVRRQVPRDQAQRYIAQGARVVA